MSSKENEQVTKSAGSRGLWLLWPVVIAGEAIFLLPFVLPRLFRPTMLQVWNIDNVDLGLAFSAYGVVAAVAYFFGGLLGDRFDPRRLMAIALVATSVGGLCLLQNPSPAFLRWVYAYFGLTTILLFWSPMLRVTHQLGGDDSQGAAFGILDAGRGLFAALMATVMATVFAFLLPMDNPSDEELARGLRSIIIIASITVSLSAAILLIALRNLPSANVSNRSESLRFSKVMQLARQSSLWSHGIVVLCAYCGYKSIDNYGLFGVVVFGLSDVESSTLTSITFWARPVAAVLAGLLADRVGNFRTLAALFSAMAIGNILLLFAAPPSVPWIGLIMIATSTAAMVYGLRGVYFAVFDDLRVPPTLVGTAAGIVSMIGFLPDVFFGSATGFVLDHYPGRLGHQYVFAAVAGLALLGAVATLINGNLTRRRSGN